MGIFLYSLLTSNHSLLFSPLKHSWLSNFNMRILAQRKLKVKIL